MIAGIIREQNDRSLVIQTANERIVLPREDIEAIKPSTTSMMPEGQFECSRPQEIRDLFAYLASTSQVPLAIEERRIVLIALTSLPSARPSWPDSIVGVGAADRNRFDGRADMPHAAPRAVCQPISLRKDRIMYAFSGRLRAAIRTNLPGSRPFLSSQVRV